MRVGDADCVLVDGLDSGDGRVDCGVYLGAEDAAGAGSCDWRSRSLDLDEQMDIYTDSFFFSSSFTFSERVLIVALKLYVLLMYERRACIYT